ncbi:MAG: CBS domain-containing protein, partial [Hyphomicrobiaceae bacterium]
MVNAVYSMPLVGIDAVALNTETTGLDAKTARVVQIGSVRIASGALRQHELFDRLVNPGVPIPARSSEVHGIRDGDVSGSPAFGDVAAELERFVGGAILIGHTIDYDLAVLRREYEIAGRAWKEMRSLDLRHLARIATPGNARYDLDGVCEALGIKIEGRHTAIGNALAAGSAFLALVPLLKKQGVHTLGELAAAIRALSEREAAAGGGLIAAPLPLASDRVHSLVKVDSFPYRHRVRDVMSSPPVTASEDTTIREAAGLLIEKRISSLLVPAPGKPHGIVTERDVLRAITAHGAAAFERPIGDFLSRPLHTVEESAFVYRAIGRMDRLSIRHLGVVDEQGALVGALTTRNLLRHRATTAMMLGDRIDTAQDVATIAQAWSQLPLMARMLLDEQVDARVIAAVISSEIAAITRRAAQF